MDVKNLSQLAVKSAAYRAARTAIVTWCSTIIVAWLTLGSVGGQRITGLWDVIGDQWDVASGVAFVAALGSLGWRFGLDRLPIPSLKDPDTKVAEQAVAAPSPPPAPAPAPAPVDPAPPTPVVEPPSPAEPTTTAKTAPPKRSGTKRRPKGSA